METINLLKKFDLFNEQWSPRIIGEANGQYIKLAKVQGELIRHNHPNEDEIFIVLKGELTLTMDEGTVVLKEGEMYIVPKGVDHTPSASEETYVMLIEPKSTAHTGDTQSEQTVAIEDQKWI
jgi:mannose-6-phosphate isomerase-like protein (cupin superfamily)